MTDKKRILDWRKDYRNARHCRFTGDGSLVISSVETRIKDNASSELAAGAIHNAGGSICWPSHRCVRRVS